MTVWREPRVRKEARVFAEDSQQKFIAIGKNFLENKVELFRYIAEEITEKFMEKVVVYTVEATVVCNQTEEDLTLLSSCNHEVESSCLPKMYPKRSS